MPLSQKGRQLGAALTILTNARGYLGGIVARRLISPHGKQAELLTTARDMLTELDSRIRRDIRGEFYGNPAPQDESPPPEDDDQAVRDLLL